MDQIPKVLLNGVLYDAGHMIDKTFIAKVRVAIYRLPRNSEKPFAFVEAGQPIGIVDTYLEANTSKDRKEFWWCFYEGGQYKTGAKAYYVPNRNGFFDTSLLRQQGVFTVAQVTAKKESEIIAQNQSIPDKIESNLKKIAPWILGAVVAVPLLREVIRKKMR